MNTFTTILSEMQYHLEYIWLDNQQRPRSKSRIVSLQNLFVTSIPEWNYDGSSTGQATTESSEVILKPVVVFRDPFIDHREIGMTAWLVLCETYDSSGVPLPTNTRNAAVKIFEQYSAEDPWFGIEQEFFLINREHDVPLGCKVSPSPSLQCLLPKPQGDFYCGVGSENAFGRDIVMKAYKLALNAGLRLAGLNAEVAPGQWEIQVGICKGIEAADHLTVLRYLLYRVTEWYPEIRVSIHSKPNKSTSVNGSGLHTNFSTKRMREPSLHERDTESVDTESGIDYIINNCMKKYSEKHALHMSVYGDDNVHRLTGKLETSNMDKFTFGIGDRSASIRIPTETAKKGYGYIEDRRPSASADPYLVTSILLGTIGGPQASP